MGDENNIAQCNRVVCSMASRGTFHTVTARTWNLGKWTLFHDFYVSSADNSGWLRDHTTKLYGGYLSAIVEIPMNELV